ncbi:MAG: hypothetical protein Q9170_001590 [Blastenia crenularia]
MARLSSPKVCFDKLFFHETPGPRKARQVLSSIASPKARKTKGSSTVSGASTVRSTKTGAKNEKTVLFSLAVIVFVENFHRSTPFIDMLPAGREFFSHPFKFAATYGHVYKLHTDYVSTRTAERRKRMADDVEKRSRYRKAHGLEENQGFWGWTLKSDAELSESVLPSKDPPAHFNSSSNGIVAPDVAKTQSNQDVAVKHSDQSAYVDFQGKRRPVKKWLGIWE